MSNSIVLNVSILKELSILQKAVEEFVDVSNKKYLKQPYEKITHGCLYVIDINKLKTISNVRDIVLEIRIEPKANHSSSIVKVGLTYGLKNNSFCEKLSNTFYYKRFIKTQALYQLLDFKKQAEKWL